MTQNYDAIIIGGGSAGMACAVRAAQLHLTICIIEIDKEIGGTLHLTAGHLSAANTKRQAEKNIKDSVNEHFDDLLKISKNTLDNDIALKAVNLAPNTINWLQDLGYTFHENTPIIIYGHEAYSTARTYFGDKDYGGKDIKGSGKAVLNTLLPLFKKKEAEQKIVVFYNHQLTNLIKNNEEIIAIHTLNIETKKEVIFTTKNIPVIITTGGYAANANFYTKVMQPFLQQKEAHYPNRLLSSAHTNSQGQGIEAILNIGGQFVGAEKHISTLGGIELEPNSGRTSFWDAWARVSNSKDRTPREIYINENGERFMNEQDLTVDQRERIVLKQPNQRFYAIMDEASLQAGPCIVVQWNVEQFKAEAEKEKCCWAANSIEELAEKIGVPKNNLVNTVKDYNNSVSIKKDDAFNRSILDYDVKSPPYYAILIYAYSLISFGGIKVNTHLQVLNQNNAPIKNLYAAGEILGAAATSGNAFCGGMLLTPALSFGKWLAEEIAENKINE
jgi:fumarate reductase flavoprotein subunit